MDTDNYNLLLTWKTTAINVSKQILEFLIISEMIAILTGLHLHLS
jgi:hypothetical protein